MTTNHQISFTMSSRQRCFQCVRPVVENFARTHGLTERMIFSLTLVLDELITNIQSYGYLDLSEHFIEVLMELCGPDLTIRIEDDARPFNILEAPEPELDTPVEDRERPVGGMGILIVRNSVDDIHYERSGDRNVVTMRKRLKETDFVLSPQTPSAN